MLNNRPTLDKKTLHTRRLVASLLIGASIAMPFVDAAHASADPIPAGCQADRGFWLFKGTVRSICDTPQRPDGSWTRYREFWTPAHWVRGSGYCSRYGGCSYTEGYYQERTTNGVENYVVFPDNVLPDEPGHLN